MQCRGEWFGFDETGRFGDIGRRAMNNQGIIRSLEAAA